jgi:RNA polymerase sigma-70 factor (ECF subfamily)
MGPVAVMHGLCLVSPRVRSGWVTDGALSPVSLAASLADRAMDRYAAGDDAAFSELYDLIAPRLLGYLTRHTRDVARAEDLVHETMLRIHRARGRFLPGARVLPWAMAIARRLMIDDVRHRKGDQKLRSIDEENAAEIPDKGPTPADQVEARELGARIQAELSRLPDAQREAFELIKQEELSLAEAAAVLGTTVAAVKLRAHRAYVALRISLGDLAGSPPGADDAPEAP